MQQSQMHHPCFLVLRPSNWMNLNFRKHWKIVKTLNYGDVSWGIRTQWKTIHPWWCIHGCWFISWVIDFIYYRTQYLHNLQLLFEGLKLCTYQIWVTKPSFWTKLKGSCIWKQIVKTRSMGLEIWRIGLKLTLEDSINFFQNCDWRFCQKEKTN